jgi:hypothetical protein
MGPPPTGPHPGPVARVGDRPRGLPVGPRMDRLMRMVIPTLSFLGALGFLGGCAPGPAEPARGSTAPWEKRPSLPQVYRPTGHGAAGDVFVHLFEWTRADEGYPGLYTSVDFHPPCDGSDYQSEANVQDCQRFGRADLHMGAGEHFAGAPGKTLAQLALFPGFWGVVPSDKAVVFIQNHDTQRDAASLVGDFDDGDAYRLAYVWMLAQPYGHPKVMSGYAFNSRDRAIAGLVAFRRTVAGTEIEGWWDDGSNAVAFSRGTVASWRRTGTRRLDRDADPPARGDRVRRTMRGLT